MDETIQKRYDSISEFNLVYETSFSSWEALKLAENWRPSKAAKNEREDAG